MKLKVCTDKRGSTRFFITLFIIIAIICSLPTFVFALTAADKTALTAAINFEFSDGMTRTVYNLTSTDYSDVTWNNYSGAIQSAIEVESNIDADQLTVDMAADSIADAKDALEFAGKTALDAAVNSANALNQADFTPDSWTLFISARDSAFAMPESTNLEVTGKTDAVNSAIGLLVNQYRISVLVNSTPAGTVSGGGTYADDGVTQATITAIPNAGYYFAYWLEGSTNVSTQYTYSFPVTSARTIKAVFGQITAPVISTTPSSYNKITITWSAVKGAVSYEVYRASSATGSYSLVGKSSSLSYANTGVSTGQTYYYKVRAKCTAGTVITYGSYSAYKSVKTTLGAVSGLTAARASYNSINLTWSAVSGANGYEIYRSTSATSGFVIIKSTSATTLLNTGLVTGTKYYYKVRAFRMVGTAKRYGAFSAIKNAAPSLNSLTGLSASSALYGSTVRWNAVSGATSYQIYRSTSATTSFVMIKETSLLSFKDSGLTANRTYYYKVRACRTAGTVKVYDAFVQVQVVPRAPYEPNYNVICSSYTNLNTGNIAIYFQNTGSQPIRIYNEDCLLYDYDYYDFDRLLQLTDSSGYAISWIEIPAGSSAYIYFDIVGDNTWYDSYTKIFYTFTYDTIKYYGYSSSHFGSYYEKIT